MMTSARPRRSGQSLPCVKGGAERSEAEGLLRATIGRPYEHVCTSILNVGAGIARPTIPQSALRLTAPFTQGSLWMERNPAEGVFR